MDWHSQAFYRVGAMAIIRNAAGQILMVDEHGGLGLPGGGWDHGESLHECLVRELYEEAAITTPFRERVVGVIPFYNPNKQAYQLWVGCAIEYDELEFGVGEHASEVRWVDRYDIDADSPEGSMILQLLDDIDINPTFSAKEKTS